MNARKLDEKNNISFWDYYAVLDCELEEFSQLQTMIAFLSDNYYKTNLEYSGTRISDIHKLSQSILNCKMPEVILTRRELTALMAGVEELSSFSLPSLNEDAQWRIIKEIRKHEDWDYFKWFWNEYEIEKKDKSENFKNL